MGRLLAVVGGIAWLLATALVALSVHWSARPAVVPRNITMPALITELNAGRPREGESWMVTKASSAHHVLVVNATADRVTDARAIAEQIIEPVLDSGYEEILVYVWGRTSGKVYADRRVQWTPRGGYTELVIGDE